MNLHQSAVSLAQFWAAQRRWRSLGGSTLEAFQDARAKTVIDWVASRSSFYRVHWAGHELGDWRRLPVVNKRLMMENFSGFNTVGIQRETALTLALRAERERNFSPTLRGADGVDYTVGLSSGTSGHRGLFLVSPHEQAAWAGLMLSRALHRPLPEVLLRGERIAFFLRANSNLYQRIGQGPLRFLYFDLMMPLPEAARRLEDWQPTILVAPASLLLALARAQPKIRPHRVIAVAEVLEPQDKLSLERVFQVLVHQIYQATEGLIAISCRCGRLHLQEDIVAVQLEPAAGDTTGRRFTPVLTDLWRRAQPIIRYQLNDTLHMDAAPCPCGNPWRVIEQIEGRSDDTLEFHSASGPRLVFPDTLRRAVLLASDAILEYQVLQREPHQVSVTLEVLPGQEAHAVAAVLHSLNHELARYGITAARIEVGIGIAPHQADIKLRRVKREHPLT